MEHTVRDIPIYYEIHGSGTPILMIHGWSPDHRLMKGCMEPIFQSMETPWQRIYFDLPGMGKTPGKPWITGSDQMLEVVLEFIAGIILNQRFLVAGESYGGYLARGVIKARAALVDGLLLICPVAAQEIWGQSVAMASFSVQRCARRSRAQARCTHPRLGGDDEDRRLCAGAAFLAGRAPGIRWRGTCSKERNRDVR